MCVVWEGVFVPLTYAFKLCPEFATRLPLACPIPSHDVHSPLRTLPPPPGCRFLLSREQGRPPPSDRRGGKGMPWERNLQQMLDENGAGMMQKRVRGVGGQAGMG